MIRAFKQHINQNLPFLKNKKLLIANSGGIDSTVLTHLMHRSGFDISLAHCNFSLRGKESNKDEKFVKRVGEELQIAAYTITFDTKSYAEKKGISTQMAARKLRYDWFQKICNEHRIDYIITAHHKDDTIETFIINLTRGTGLNGLTGIPMINKNIIRPLLPFTREEILIYATRNKLEWREDSSNSSIKYIRNKIRHKVVPILKEINPNLLESFEKTLEHLTGSQEIAKDRIKSIRAEVSKKIGKERHYSVEALQNLSNPKAYLFELFRKKGFTEWNDVYNLLSAQTGKQVLSKTHRLLKNRDVIILSKLKKKSLKTQQIDKQTKSIKKPISLRFSFKTIVQEGKNKANALDLIIQNREGQLFVDADKLKFPLTIRKWEKGDFFYPIGLNGKKKLSKFFTDEKMSLLEKEKTWLLCSGEDIVWVIGKRLDERFKVTMKTTTVLKIKH
jgi:tRNA(Ile)-lysidine synthase